MGWVIFGWRVYGVLDIIGVVPISFFVSFLLFSFYCHSLGDSLVNASHDVSNRTIVQTSRDRTYPHDQKEQAPSFHLLSPHLTSTSHHTSPHLDLRPSSHPLTHLTTPTHHARPPPAQIQFSRRAKEQRASRYTSSSCWACRWSTDGWTAWGARKATRS